jgi:putative aldouronate transport system permease protein
MYGAQIAFRDFKLSQGILGSEWVGFKHFLAFFASRNFTRTLSNTLTLSVYSLIVNTLFVITLSLLIHCVTNELFKKIVQTVVYLPHFISTVVMVALILIWLNPDTGLWGNIYRLFNTAGGKIPDPMASKGAFSSLYVWSDIWQHNGWNSIIFFAALASVDPSLYESATVDGASRLQKIFYIDLPMLLPTATILLILSAGGILNLGFEKVFLMQNNLNITASEVISTYIYKIGLTGQYPQFSFSTAVNLFQTVINLFLLIMVNTASRRLSDNSLW